jgi:hypothetical protein
MTDDTDDVDPEDPRPDGRFHVLRDADWHLVDENARTISLGPATDAEPGDDWILSFTSDAGEQVAARLSPRALQELHVEARSLDPDTRQAGHTAACDFCGQSVELRTALPNDRGEPVHRRCYVEAYGGPAWIDG